MKKRKVLLSLVLTLAMVFTLLPVMVFAEGKEDEFGYRLAICVYDDQEGEYVATSEACLSVDDEQVCKAQLYVQGEEEEQEAEDYTVEWSSDNPEVVFVESQYEDQPNLGWVKGEEAGEAVITASAFIDGDKVCEASTVFSVSVKDDDGSYDPGDDAINEFREYTAEDLEELNPGQMEAGDEESVDTSEEVIFKFVAPRAEQYVFYSNYERDDEDDYEADPKGRVIDDQGNIVEEDDDSTGNNFAVYFDAEEGAVYYLQAINYKGTAVFNVGLTENNVQSVMLTPKNNKPYELIEGLDGNTEDGYWDEETQEYVDKEYFHYWTPNFQDGDKLTIKTKDGSDIVSTVYTYQEHNEEGAWVGAFVNGNDQISCDRFAWESDQSYENQWKVNNQYEYTFKYGNKTAPEKVKVKIIPNNFKGFEVRPRVFGIVENEDGWYDNPFWHEGTKIIIGSTTYTCREYPYGKQEGAYSCDFISDSGEHLKGQYLYSDMFQEEPWVIGGKGYTVTVNYMGKTVEIPVVIVKSEADKKEVEAKADAIADANDAIKAANTYKAELYTFSSFTALTNAKNALNALLKNQTATSTQIKTAINTLNSAIKNLKKKAANPLKVVAKNKTFKVKKLKKKKQAYKALTVTGAQGAVSYTVKPSNKKAKKALKFDQKTGKITVKKKTKKGKYKITIYVKAAGNGNYNASSVISKDITVKVK